MFIIPGEVISAVTFPGVIVHELGHLMFCRLRRVPVLDVCFFRFGNPAGYVVHEKPVDFLSTFLVTIGPFLLNSLVCILLCLPAYFPLRVFDVPDPLSYLLMWLGLSIGMHAFPSTGDASGLFDHAKAAAKRANPLAILSLPLVLAIYLANFGRFFWLDLMYGAAIGWGLPALLVEWMA